MARCEPVELDYLDRAPFRFTASELVNATPERVFEIFQDAVAWTKWVQVIKKVEWTSPFPLGVGSTRTVHMAGGLRGDETFIAWEPNERMAFRFDELSVPVGSAQLLSAFAEDYRVTDVRLGQSRVDWTLCMTPSGAGAVTARPAKPLMAFEIRRTLKRFARYVDATSRR